LHCTPEQVFREFADPLFTQRIGFGAGSEVEVLYQDARFVSFRTTVARPGGAAVILEPERIQAPESLTVVTLRRGLAAFRYNIIVDCFTPHESGTRLTHVDEFESVTDAAVSDAALHRSRETTRLFMDTIRTYYDRASTAESKS